MSFWRDKGLEIAKTLDRRKTDWSSERIAAVRKLAAQGHTCAEIIEALGLHITPSGLRCKCKKLGMVMNGKSKRISGLAERSSLFERKSIDNRSFRAGSRQ